MLRVLADEPGGGPPVTKRPGRAALRNAGLLLIQRAGLVVAGLGFAAVIP